MKSVLQQRQQSYYDWDLDLNFFDANVQIFFRLGFALRCGINTNKSELSVSYVVNMRELVIILNGSRPLSRGRAIQLKGFQNDSLNWRFRFVFWGSSLLLSFLSVFLFYQE